MELERYVRKKSVYVLFISFRMEFILGVIVIDIFIRFFGIFLLGRMYLFKIIFLYIGYKDFFFFY